MNCNVGLNVKIPHASNNNKYNYEYDNTHQFSAYFNAHFIVQVFPNNCQ